MLKLNYILHDKYSSDQFIGIPTDGCYDILFPWYTSETLRGSNAYGYGTRITQRTNCVYLNPELKSVAQYQYESNTHFVFDTLRSLSVCLLKLMMKLTDLFYNN